MFLGTFNPVSLFIVVFTFADCPALIPPFEEERETIDGITYSMGLVDELDRFILTNYRDNRTTTTDMFFSIGVATLGHKNVFQERVVEYRMNVDLPDGRYTLIDYSHKHHSHPFKLCVKDKEKEVVLYIEDNFFGPVHYSYVWDFEIYVDAKSDINNDGIVDGADLAALLSEWGSDNEQADLNGDGVVNSEDLTILLASWSQ